jgi:hypothetical protein
VTGRTSVPATRVLLPAAIRCSATCRWPKSTFCDRHRFRSRRGRAA